MDGGNGGGWGEERGGGEVGLKDVLQASFTAFHNQEGEEDDDIINQLGSIQ